ncbi:MAG: hypothetical protein ACYCO9_18800 [Streptosporangiaceae bacterium]
MGSRENSEREEALDMGLPRWLRLGTDRDRSKPDEADRDQADRDEADRDEADRDQATLDDIGYRPNVNQIRDEPMPASQHDEPHQEAEVRNEEYHARRARARSDATGLPPKPDGEVDTRRP